MTSESDSGHFDEYELDAVRFVKGRLQHYPTLYAFAERLAIESVNRACEIRTHLHRYDEYKSYFAVKQKSLRWLQVLSYRESLRLVLDPEPVEAALDKLPENVRLNLRIRYVDQLNNQESVRILQPLLKAANGFDAVAAQKCALQAYSMLVYLLPRSFAGMASGMKVSSEFPLFPHVVF